MSETWVEIRSRHRAELVSAIQDLADEGLHVGLVAGRLGISVSYVRNYLDGVGAKVNFTRKGHPPAGGSIGDRCKAMLQERTAMNLIRPRLTCEEAAGRLGINYDTLRTYSTRHDMDWKPAGAWA